MQTQSLPSVYIVVLNYNGKSTLFNCLSAIYQSDYKNFEVVVVDNDSRDGSFEQARHDFSRVHFIKNSTNVGFSQGNNIGIRFALEKFADYVLVLNNDALIEKSTLSKLVISAQQNSQAGIISPLILAADNKQIWFAGGKILWDKMKNVHINELSNNKPYTTEYVSGCAMFIKKEVFKEVGLFDERYFLYYEDADFSLRASKAGFDLLIDPTFHIRHLEQSNEANQNKLYWLVLSALIFFHTHSTWKQKVWLYSYLLLRKLKNLYLVLFTKSADARMVRKAYREYKKIPA